MKERGQGGREREREKARRRDKKVEMVDSETEQLSTGDKAEEECDDTQSQSKKVEGIRDGLNMKRSGEWMAGVLRLVSWDPAAVCIIHGGTRFVQGDLPRSRHLHAITYELLKRRVVALMTHKGWRVSSLQGNIDFEVSHKNPAKHTVCDSWL